MNIIATGFIGLWMAGFVPLLGGFVKYDDFVEVRAGQLRDDIKRNERIRCMYAGRAGQGFVDIIDYATREIESLQSEYQTRTGEYYSPPPCSVLLVVEG